MQRNKRTVELTDEQISCMRESLRYSERAIRDYDYSPLDHAAASKLRNDKLTLLASVREALGDGPDVG